MNDAWNPQKYLEFKKERAKPFYDLMKMVVQKEGMDVLDLGCGTGTLTKVLHESLKAKSTLGIDSSKEMLNQARSLFSEGLKFSQEDIRSFSPPKVDLIFSNAALHWVENHEYLLERFSKALKPGGQIAVQVPCNFSFPTHTIAEEIAHETPFKEPLKHVKYPSVLTIEEYSTLFYQIGAKEQRVLAEIYPMTLESAEKAIDWVKGSLLTHYRSHLSNVLYEEFFSCYSERIKNHFGKGPVFIPFKRILMWSEF